MRRAAFALFATIAGLVGLLSFKTSSAAPGAVPAAASTAGPGTTSGGSSSIDPPTKSAAPSGAASTSRAASSSNSKGSASRTVTGRAVDTQYGPVQVRITVAKGKVTSVTAVNYPTQGPRDEQINSYAIPALNKEALAAGSAQIDMISGATYTSTGYIDSLQSALNKAGL